MKNRPLSLSAISYKEHYWQICGYLKAIGVLPGIEEVSVFFVFAFGAAEQQKTL
jgi:hypothetical protein